MSYAVKEMFLTVQGEGVRAGTVAVFLRFAGCNLWTGLEKDRASAVCKFCDTDFVKTDGVNGGRFQTADALAAAVASAEVIQPVPNWEAATPRLIYVLIYDLLMFIIGYLFYTYVVEE